jgi:hypothetical protein
MELIAAFVISLVFSPVLFGIIHDAIRSHKARRCNSILSAYLRNYVKTLRK